MAVLMEKTSTFIMEMGHKIHCTRTLALALCGTYCLPGMYVDLGICGASEHLILDLRPLAAGLLGDQKAAQRTRASEPTDFTTYLFKAI